MNKIKDIQDKEKQAAWLTRAKAVGLTDEASTADVEAKEAEKKAAEATGAKVVEVAEQDVKALLSEIKGRIKDGVATEESLKAMITEAVSKVNAEAKTRKEEATRKGEFAGEDADPGKDFSHTGKVSSRFTLKHFVTGNAPKRVLAKHAEELREIQDLNDEILIVSKCMGIHPKETDLWQEYEKASRDFARKVLVSTTASNGDEFVPTNFSAQVVDKVRLELKVAALHDRIPMRSNPYTVPIEGADATAYLAAENTAAATEASRYTESSPGTGNVTFTAQKLVVRTVFSDEITQDSIVDILDYVRRKIAIALSNAIEDATINGDTTATHQDGDVTAASDRRKAWKGYRKLSPSGAKKDAGGDALDAADLRACRKLMGKYGVNPADLAWVVGVSAYAQMLSESDSAGFDDFRTLDKLGPQATILSGMLGIFDGIPVIVSEFVRENLNASGVYDTTTQTRTAINLVNRTRFWFGDRRLVTLKTFEDIQTDQMVMVIKQRLDFQPVEAATNALVGTVYNILA
jgi:HK97 family phage major capsid protein